jgi:hypothetical protein
MNDADSREHEQHVDRWLLSCRGRAPGEPMGSVLLVALRALWSRARPTVGEVTLGAVFRRVLETATLRHPELGPLGLRVAAASGPSEISIAVTSSPADLTLAARFLLVEVLRVVARLTAGALTPALHAALDDAGVRASDPAEGRGPATPRQGAPTDPPPRDERAEP